MGDTASLSAAASRMTVSVSDPSLQGGERVRVKLAKEGSENAMLVSGQAVHKDISGTYVYALEERQGPLGNAYYASRRKVTIIDADGSVVAVSGDLYDGEQVITDSSEPLQDGTRVRP